MIAAGDLRDIIKIQEPVRVSDGSGGYDTTYVDVISKTYAKVVEDRSSSQVVADQDNINNSVHFKIRYRPVLFLKIGNRLIWRNFIFTINNIKIDYLRTEIDIFVNSDMETSER